MRVRTRNVVVEFIYIFFFSNKSEIEWRKILFEKHITHRFELRVRMNALNMKKKIRLITDFRSCLIQMRSSTQWILI